jgi:threonine dehydratase
MRWLVAEERMVVEPAAAAPVAALLQPARQWPGPIVAIITGQNLAPELVSAVTSTR